MPVRVRYLAIALVMLADRASAADIVICPDCTQEVTTDLNNVLIAAQWVTQLARMEQQITQQIGIFQSLSGVTNVNGMMPILNQAGNFNQMGSFGNVPLMLQGQGFGNLGGLGQGYMTQNTVFLPNAGSQIPLMNAVATLFQRRAGSLSSVQAISTQLMNNSTVILAGLRGLQQLIDTQPSSQLMGGMNSRLASYQGNINSQQYQLSQTQAFVAAQQRVYDQQEQQAVLCSASSLVRNNASLSGAVPEIAGNGNCRVGAVGGFGGAVAGLGGLGTLVGGAGALAQVGAVPATDTGGFDTPVTTQTATNAALPVPPVPPPLGEPAPPSVGIPGDDPVNVIPNDPTDDGSQDRA
jgi:hypothetical protein